MAEIPDVGVRATLHPLEMLIAGTDELLWRQVNPVWVQDGVLTSQIFRRSSTEPNGFSVGRESLVTAERSYEFFTEELNLASCGVWAISVEEVDAVDMLVIDDSQLPLRPGERRAPGHAYVDGRHLPGKAQLTRAKYLRDAATARGRQWPAESLAN